MSKFNNSISKDLINSIQNARDKSSRVFVNIEGKQYPVDIQGTGKIACLCIGIGSLYQRTLSNYFKEIFAVYAIDLYFTHKYKLNDPTKLSMKDLGEHIIEVCRQLDLNKPVIFGHSCFGILALEVAKIANKQMGGILLVASAPEWNMDSIQKTNQYFNEHADAERISNDNQRKQKYELIRKPTDSEVSIERYIADSARYWGDFHISNEAIYALWEGIECDDVIMNHFFLHLLPQYNLAINIEKVTAPVLLLAGELDFDSIPLVQWQSYPHPKNFIIINCGAVGHWPNLENKIVFDTAVQNWVQQYFN